MELAPDPVIHSFELWALSSLLRTLASGVLLVTLQAMSSLSLYIYWRWGGVAWGGGETLSKSLWMLHCFAASKTLSFAKIPRQVPACAIASMAYSTWQGDLLRKYGSPGVIASRLVFWTSEAQRKDRELSSTWGVSPRRRKTPSLFLRHASS